MEKAIGFIEENTDENTKFTRAFFSELHKIITKNLSSPPDGEGSRFPGQLRKANVQIAKSKHNPPDYILVPDYFEEFLRFINQNLKEQYQLLMVAIAHHSFAWIHPYDNGNGRLVRLLTYAFLIKLGFKVKNGRILNPSAVFYTNREKYYKMLETADHLDNQSLLLWSEYFLSGLKNEIEKIDSLLNIDYVREKILIPAIKFALDRQNITPREYRILKYLIQKNDFLIKSEELNKIGISNSVQKSRIMKKIRDRNIIRSIKENGRIYTINFVNNYLLRGVINSLDINGFVSDFLNKN
ncbi:MAG: Fic family protein [Spirochaetes bacterium]|nr:Fic family protein [Spirochaetota bacterium]